MAQEQGFQDAELLDGQVERPVRFFDGLELVGPGLVEARNWKSLGAARPPTETGWHILTGVGCKS